MTDSQPNGSNDETSHDPGQGTLAGRNQVTNDVDKNQIAQFVSTIKNAEQQVGEHIITALQHADTVAVITTVTMGSDGQQRIVSAALNPDRMQQVQQILETASDEREDEEPCIGFHCLVKPKRNDESSLPPES